MRITRSRSRGPSDPEIFTKNKKMKKETKDWSALPQDLLRLISQCLTSEIDGMRFRSVCSSWLLAAIDRRPSPWLVGQTCSGWHSSYSFFSLSGAEIRPFDTPEIGVHKVCCGSSHGWLALMGIGLQITLYNPITRAQIPLPRIPDFLDVFGIRTQQHCLGRKYHYDPTGRCTRQIEDLLWDLVFKVVLSSNPASTPDCTVVLVARSTSRGSRLAFCRPGDCEWALVRMPEFIGFKKFNADPLFYKGQLYIASRDLLFRCSLGPNPEVPEPSLSHTIWNYFHDFRHFQSFLVESCGDLLLVAHVFHNIESDEIRVHRVLDDASRMIMKLSASMKELGDRAIFVGRNQSFSVPASKFPGLKGNCVYLVDYDRHEGNEDKKIKVFNVATGHTEIIPYCFPDPCSFWKPCIWITPSLL